MKFGAFYLHQVPRPWDQETEHRYFKDALAQVELLDRVGFDYFWVAEHHFLEEYSHSSAPEIFLAACTQRTSRIRLGQGIVQLPPLINHPVRVAERIATLDLISDGRIEFGTGEGACEGELESFHVSLDEKRAMWLEGLQAVSRLLVEAPFQGYQGKYLDLPIRNLVPKPYQKPHPPMWLACSRYETILRAARLGLGALCFAFVTPEEAAKWVRDYYETFENECEPVAQGINPNIAVMYPFLCDRDEARAKALASQDQGFFTYGLAHYSMSKDHEAGKTDLWDEYRNHPREVNLPFGKTNCVGTPEQLTTMLREFEPAGLDQIIFLSQAGKISHQTLCSSFELFSQEVMPAFKQHEQQRAAEKQALVQRLTEKIQRRSQARKSNAA
ncbi:MAG: LLM class flavin-dependent oxidoreductase [Candidatus Binataceae bacterium]|nr:LLM class flavin-dependent oxidoreductase [Candidatus Binataceae bacterium]